VGFISTPNTACISPDCCNADKLAADFYRVLLFLQLLIDDVLTAEIRSSMSSFEGNVRRRSRSHSVIYFFETDNTAQGAGHSS
jgi:hypothetical protein